MAIAVAVGLVAFSAGSANADPSDDPVRIDYPLTGTTYLKGTDSSLTLGPGVLESTVANGGQITANTKLPPATGSFKTLDLIPVTATTEFIESEPTTGAINTATGAVSTTSKITLRITKMSIAGIPALIGDHCQTEVPAVLSLDSEPGFHVLLGGNLSGTYTIPKFEHCLLNTPLINLIIPGSGNTITLTLGPGKVVPPAS